MVPQFGANIYNSSDHPLPAQVGLSELLLIPEQQVAADLAVLLPKSISNSTILGTARRIQQFAAQYAELEASLATDPGIIKV